jgi:hypothetical protein
LRTPLVDRNRTVQNPNRNRVHRALHPVSKDSHRKNSLKLLCAAVCLVFALPLFAAQLWIPLAITGSPGPDKLSGLLTYDIGVLAYDETTHQLFAGGQGTSPGLRSSRDEGRTWQLVTAEGPVDIAIDSVDHSHMYLGLREGILRTEDGGHSWESVFHSRSAVSGIAIDRNNHSTVYAVNDAGFWKSIDSGQTWKQPSGSINKFQSILSAPQSAHLMAYGTTDNVIWDSTDGGKSWTPVWLRFALSPQVSGPARTSFGSCSSTTNSTPAHTTRD